MYILRSPAGANYRIYRTAENGGLFFTNVAFHWVRILFPSRGGFRQSVKVQFSSDAIECNALIINGELESLVQQ